MDERYLLYKATSWIQNRPWLMFLVGLGCLISLLDEFTGYQAVGCLISGIINLTTGLGARYQRLTVRRMVTVGHLLSIVGFWSLLIGFVNLNSATPLFLPETCLLTGSVAVIWFLLFKIMKL